MAKSANTKPFYNDIIPSDWTTPEFGTVFSFLKTYAFSREQLVDEETDEGIQNIHYGDIHSTFENEILDFELEKRIPFVKDGLIHNGKAEKEIDWLEDGDLIIADASEDYAGVAECIELKNVNGRKIVSGLHTFASRDKSGKSAQGYRTYLLNHPQVVRELRRIATGFSVFGISKTNITKVKLPLPPSKEQEAIADLLQLMDTAINKNNQLIEKKELQKRGLMQYYLSEDYNSFNTQYERVKLSKYTKKIKGKVYESSTDKSGLPCITAASFDSNYTEFTHTTGAIKCEPNDVLVLWDGENAGAVTTGHQGIIGSTVAKLMLNEKLNNYYITFHFQYYNQKLRAIREGSGVPHMPGDFEDWYHFHIPPMTKQLEISKVLKSADTEIKLLKAKTDKLREKKKGLMQQLLTGKVRLKINNTI